MTTSIRFRIVDGAAPFRFDILSKHGAFVKRFRRLRSGFSRISLLQTGRFHGMLVRKGTVIDVKTYISPSILSCDFGAMRQELISLTECGADMAHIDVMDGNFVPNITLGPCIVSALRGCTTLLFDVHLMIDEPIRYIEDFAKAGADLITFHLEAASDVGATIGKIAACGCKAGIAIKPGTPVEAVYPYLDRVDMVLVMTVEPGFGGQSYMADMEPKVAALRKKCPDLLIQVDGGINETTVKTAAQAGANVIVAGSYVFKAADRRAAIETLREGARF